nr:immunoglobulin light chain junction region [Macaca mulatta]MOX24688.1 immunoglobulin light chain junction region [Macaca mulatta]MOX27043.1 immunoglobulin light chain junction region [Macaca mulatta]MOX27986.1 immunoglobulin light chain junction region [Macaca mulatta]
CLQGYSVPLTF